MLYLLISLFVAHGAHASDLSWTSCYSKKQNRLYFKSTLDKRKSRKCIGNTSFKGFKNHTLIETHRDGNQFSAPRAGIPKNITIRNGREFVVTQWNDLSPFNRIVVLEPILNKRKVRKLCVLENYGEAFSARYNHKRGKIEVLINQAVDPSSGKYKRVWRGCKI